MNLFLSWYFLITLLGWVSFPLAFKVFSTFADRGYTVSRVLGLLIWSYLFWIFTSFGITQNDKSGIALALVFLLAASAVIFLDRRDEILLTLKENKAVVIATEVLFLLTFTFLAVMRAANPEILGTEKPMELAFINAVLRSPTFPPHDPWLSGYAISYYHFGYIITAMLAKFTSTPGTAAFNLMISLVFGLGAVGAYGVLYNLLAPSLKKIAVANSLFAPLFLLIVSNIEGLFHVMYTRGLFAATNFWEWINLKDMTTPPADSGSFIPTQFWWWWRASRVIYDSDLLGNHQEVIDEFPFFSFLLGDLHPHVLAIPFGLLVIAFALQIYRGASSRTFGWRGLDIHLSPLEFILTSLLLGGMAFLNTWDVLFSSALIFASYLFFRQRSTGWTWALAEDLTLFLLPLALCSYIFYLPFHLGFQSQAGGILPNLINPSRGTHLWMMFAPLFVPILVYLYSSRDKNTRPVWRFGIFSVLIFTLLLWGASWALAWTVQFKEPVFAIQYLQSQGLSTLGELFNAAMLRRGTAIAGLLTLLVILIPAVSWLFASSKGQDDDELSLLPTPSLSAAESEKPSSRFVILLIIFATLLVLGPEFVYLRDQFGTRMNTIFKFYYQAWMLWSLAASYSTVLLIQHLEGVKAYLFRAALIVVLFSALIYPVLGTLNRTQNFAPYFGYTLDDFDRVQRENPDEAAAMRFLMSAPDGVVAEAIGGSYSGFARVSTYTGLPTVLGWPGHESQWRGGGAEQGSRQQDIETLYSTNNWDIAFPIINQYNIRYVFIGGLERNAYSVQEEKFQQHLTMVFQAGSVSVYETSVR